MLCLAQRSLLRRLWTWIEEAGEHTSQPGDPEHPGPRRPGCLTRLCPLQAKHLASQYWGSSRPAAVRRDPSLPYLEQYRIDAHQFRELFASLTLQLWSISPSNEHPGLISFRMDWLDLLAVQGTLKSLL